MALNLFSGGYLPLDQRVHAETLFWAICRKLQRLVQQMDEVPEDLQNLDEPLSDTYFCNFSLFQSIPDSWAIKQLFPVMPIHRLNERPTQHAVLGDITCDSDGKIDQFIDRRDVKRTLPLHPFNGDPYYLGVFLVGAYQEILGDLHNLFGDTNAVHVSLDENGKVVLDAVIKGDTVREVLDYVEFDAADADAPPARGRGTRRPRGPHGSRAVRPAAAVLRERAAGVHVPGGCAPGVIVRLRVRLPGSGPSGSGQEPVTRPEAGARSWSRPRAVARRRGVAVGGTEGAAAVRRQSTRRSTRAIGCTSRSGRRTTRGRGLRRSP